MNSVKFFAVVLIGLFVSLIAVAAPSPWDSWRSGYTNFEQGVSLRERGNYTEALNYFTRARENYLAVRAARPDWNQRVIADRLRDCDRQIAELRRLLGEAGGNAGSSSASQPLSRPAQRPAAQPPSRPAQRPAAQTPSRPAVSAPATDPGVDALNRAEREELERLRAEVARLRANNQQLERSLQRQRDFEAEMAALLRDRKAVEDRYALLEQRYRALEAELQRPQDRIAALEQRLVDERMSVERLTNQVASLEQQLRIERENARLGQVAKNSLEEILRKREEDLRQISQELAAANERLQEIAALNERNTGLAGQVADLNRQLADLRRQISEKDRQISEKDRQISEKDRQISEKDRQISERDEQIANLDRRNNESAAASADVSARASDSERVAAELRRQVSALERQISDLQNQLRTANEQNTVCQRQIQNLQNQLRAAGEQNSAREQRIAELQQEKERAGTALREAQNQNTALQSRIRTLQQNLEQSGNSARLSAAEVASLRERNRSLEEDVQRLHERTEDLERRLAIRNSEDYRAATEARTSVRRLEADLQAAQSELVRLRSELDAGKAALAESERRLKAANEETLRARAEVVAAAERERALREQLSGLQQLRAQYDELNRNFQALSAENRENRSLLEAARPQQAELERARIRLLEIDQLRNALAREQQLNAELQAAYNRDQAELQALRRRAQEFENARRRLAELEAVAKEVERLQELERELTGLRAREVELASLKVQFNELQTAHRALQSANAALTADQQQLRAEIARLRRESEELVRLRRVNRELEAMIATNTAELERLNRLLAASQAKENEDVHASCRIEAQRLRTAAEAVGPLNDQIQQLQNELQQMRRTLEAQRSKERELNRELELKVDEIEQLRRLSAELAELRQKSAGELLDRVDASRLARLEDEIAALNKLNAELAAERDRLTAILNNREQDSGENTPETPRVSNRSAEELTGSGIVAERGGKSELAVWHYRQALAVKPDFVLAHYRLGMLLFRRGSYQEASTHLESARNSAPENLQLALDTARCFIQISRFGNAKSIVDPLLVKYPENAYVQMCAGLIEAGCGAPARAEERLLMAARLAPESAEIQIELARLLANSVSDRLGEAVIAYERARELGAAPHPELERLLGARLDHRRELVRFMSGAAREAEVNNDWLSAAWYYRKIMEENNPSFAPLLAFAHWKSGNASAAKEALEFNVPSRNAMVVRALIALAENDEETAMRAAQQSAGASIPVEWIGVNLELERLRGLSDPPAAVRILLQSIQQPETSAGEVQQN